MSISEWPLYNLLNGRVHKHFERNDECIQALENSLNNLSSNESSYKFHDCLLKIILILDEHSLEHSDLVSLFLTLSECYCIAQKIDKAEKVVKKSFEYLKDTKYEGEIKLAEAKIALFKNDTENALQILNAIKPDQDTFIKV